MYAVMNNVTVNASELEDFGWDNSTCELVDRYRTARNIVTFVIVLTTYFGNTLILVSLKKYSKHFKGSLYTCIQHLAIADILLAFGLTLCLVAEVSSTLQSNKYYCLLRICFVSVSLLVSNKMLIIISVDRFCAIVFPMKHLVKSSKRRRKRIILFVTWFSSILIGCLPSAFEIDLTNSVTTFDCLFGFVMPDRITTIATIAIPLQFVINVVLCVIIAVKLKTNTMSKRNYHKSLVKCGFMLKVYVMFALCWTPFVIANVVKLTRSSPEVQTKFRCKLEYLLIPGFLNSGMNWIIYGLANMKFRKAFKKMLICDCKADIMLSSYRVEYQNTQST